jgi:hypothetical protein
LERTTSAPNEVPPICSGPLVRRIAAKPKYELIATNKLADTSRTNASPVIDNGRLLIRTDNYPYCVGKK